MKKFLLLVLPSLFVVNISLAQSGNTTLVTVNGQKITSNDLNQWVSLAVSEGAKDSPELRQSVLNDMILRDAIIQDAKKTKLLEQGSNAVKLKYVEQNAILDMWFAQYFKKHPINDVSIRAEYDRQLALSKEPKFSKEYQVAQIVVGSKIEAENIIKQINAGTSFDKLAREKSLDKISGDQGGVVGWARFDQMVSPINEIVSQLPRGGVAPEPIQTQSGWHVIKLENTKPFEMPAFDQVKDNIAQALNQRGRQEAIAELLKNTKIVNSK